MTRPLFSVLRLAWVWRLVLASIVLLRIARLPLKLVPSHPDRVGGLGFLGRLPHGLCTVHFRGIGGGGGNLGAQRLLSRGVGAGFMCKWPRWYAEQAVVHVAVIKVQAMKMPPGNRPGAFL
ncbi:MAG: hypothetical protein ACN6PE_05150 [Achromobacter marplatensis]|uniref:hypothetical protein n=1 Tax=Achromobacter marplatensis TaxID=470868 RepID=UPI003D07D260